MNSHSSLNSIASLKSKYRCPACPTALVNDVPEFEPNRDYYKLYWMAFMENQSLLEELKKQSEERNNHYLNLVKMNASQCSQSQNEEKKEQRKKHNRRCAKEINKNELCPYPNCGKYYGSEGSLNLHMKLKHEGGNKTDREKLAKSIVLSYSNNKVFPDVTLHLPPGAVEEEAKKLNMKLPPEVVRDLYERACSKFEEWRNKF